MYTILAPRNPLALVSFQRQIHVLVHRRFFFPCRITSIQYDLIIQLAMNPGNLIVRGVTYNSRDTSSIHNTASYRPKSRLLNCEQVLHVLYTGNPNEFSHQRAYTPRYAEFFKKRSGGGAFLQALLGVCGWEGGGQALSDSHT